MDIEIEIPYWGPQVATFDPEKVLWRLKEQFPEAEIDPTDWAEREVGIRQMPTWRSGPSARSRRTR